MRLPPALNVALLTTLSLLAGCLEPVDGPAATDAAAAIDDAAQAAQELVVERGHIAGAVTDDAAAPLAGVHIVLDGADAVDSDEEGRFSFVDVPVGDHRLAASKDGFVAVPDAAVAVAAQSIARPALVLAKVVPPMTFETTTFTFYAPASVFGLDLGCSCYDVAALGANATEAILEVETDSGFDGFGEYAFDVTSTLEDENGTEYVGSMYGYLSPGWPAEVPGEVLAQGDHLQVHVAPDMLGVGSLYRVYLTVFHDGPAPDGFTAVQ